MTEQPWNIRWTVDAFGANFEPFEQIPMRRSWYMGQFAVFADAFPPAAVLGRQCDVEIGAHTYKGVLFEFGAECDFTTMERIDNSQREFVANLITMTIGVILFDYNKHLAQSDRITFRWRLEDE